MNGGHGAQTARGHSTPAIWKTVYQHSHLKGKGGLRSDFTEVLDSAVACGDVRYHPKWDIVPGIMLMAQVQGFTICIIERDGQEVARGYALCSRRDQFYRRIGRDIARGRALRKLPEASGDDARGVDGCG